MPAQGVMYYTLPVSLPKPVIEEPQESAMPAGGDVSYTTPVPLPKPVMEEPQESAVPAQGSMSCTDSAPEPVEEPQEPWDGFCEDMIKNDSSISSSDCEFLKSIDSSSDWCRGSTSDYGSGSFSDCSSSFSDYGSGSFSISSSGSFSDCGSGPSSISSSGSFSDCDNGSFCISSSGSFSESGSDDSDNFSIPDSELLSDPEGEQLCLILLKKIKRSLSKVKVNTLRCSKFLLPDDLLIHLGQELMHMAYSEPCGLRGACLDLCVENGKGCHKVSQLTVDAFVVPTFHLTVLFKVDSRLWSRIQGLFSTKPVPGSGQSLKLSSEFKVLKQKLYSSEEVILEEC